MKFVFGHAAGIFRILFIAFLGSIPSLKAACIPPTAGLVDWWTGDGTVNDLAGTNRVSLKNGATFVAGEVGPAFGFDGVDDFVAVPDSPAWDFGTTNFTIEFWAKLNVLKPTMFLHQQSGTSVGGFEFYFNGATGLLFGLNSADAADSGTSTLLPNVWTHFAVTRSNNIFRIFVNGSQAANSGHFNANPVTNAVGIVRLGSYASGGYEMDGALDEISVYHRALSGSELQAIYNAASQGKCKPAPIFTGALGGGGVSRSPEQSLYAYDQVVTLTATNLPYSQFVQWEDGVTTPVRLVAAGGLDRFVAIFTNTAALETRTFKLWDRTFGGLGADNYPILRRTPDGGFIVAGATASEISGNKTTPLCGTVAAWILKLDAAGNRQWEQTVGTPADSLYIVTIEPTRDGGYLLGASSTAEPGPLVGENCGKTSPNFGSEDFWIVRLNALGERLWDASFGGEASDNLAAIAPLDDGGFILVGNSHSDVSGNKSSENYGIDDVWIVRVDESGNKIWDRSYGGTASDSALSVAVTSDGGFLVSGNSASDADGNKDAPNYGLQDFWVLRLDAIGNKLWDQSYGGNEDEFGAWMTPTLEGGAVLAGYTDSPIGGTRTAPGWGGLDYWVVRIDADGHQLWDRAFGGTGDFDWAYHVTAAADGGVLVLGESDSGISGNKTTVHFGNSDGWLVRLDPWGEKVSECSLGGTEYDYLYSADRTAPNAFILAGASFSEPGGNKTAPNFGAEDIWLIKIAERIAPVGTPVILVDGLFSTTNVVTVTNSALIEIQTTFDDGLIFYTLDGAPPANGTLYTGPFLLEQSATIRAMAFNVAGQASPEVEPLNVAFLEPPRILLQPQNQTVGTGEDALFAVVVAGTPPLHFQWLNEGLPVPGATNATLLLTNVPPTPPLNLAVVINNAFGVVTSIVAQLNVLAPPTILTQPVSTTVSVSGSVTFSVSALGPPPLQFQWRKNGVNIPGATASTLTIANAQLDDGASYSVVVASPGGTLASNPAQLNVTVPSPAANDNFVAASALSGASGVASGTNNFATRESGEPLHAGKQGSNSVWYTWQAPAQGIATFRTTGSTFDTLLAIYTGTGVNSLTNIANDEDNGGFLTSLLSFNANTGVTYRIAVDGFGRAQGHFILRWQLEQTNATQPVITCHPANRTVLAGMDASFTVSATGPALSYRWFFNSAELLGQTSASLSITNVQRPNVGFYVVRVTGTGNRSVDSLPAILEIGPFANVQSREKPDDIFPTCAGGFALAGAASVAMGSIGSQILVGSFTNSTLDCITTNCGGIPTGIRYLDYTAPANGTFAFDTVGSVPRTKLWVCRLGASTLDARSVIKCDISSATDSRSTVRFPTQAGISYRAIVAKLDSIQSTPQLNWKFGLPPVFTALSSNRFLESGSTLDLNVTAQNVTAPGVNSPLAPPTYRWFFNGTLMSTNPTMSLPNVTAAHAGLYRVDVSNDLGMTSAVVRVEVYGAPGKAVVNTGDMTELFADTTTNACPDMPVRYQWRLNGMPLTGETNRNLLLRNTQPTQAGQYSVTVSNCIGLVTYPAASLAVTVNLDLELTILSGSQVQLQWRTTAGKHYRVEFRPSFDATAWSPLVPDITGTGNIQQITDNRGPAPRFYRIGVLD